MLSLLCSSSFFNTFITPKTHKDSTFLPFSTSKPKSPKTPFQFSKNPSFSHQNIQISSPNKCIYAPKSAESDSEAETSGDFDDSSVSTAESEWLSRLPDKKKPLYAHSLPCIEAWLKSLGFYQSRDDRAVWFVEKPDWHAQLSLDITDLYIRYLKNGPGNLEKDVERRFSYALSREDIENAVLGGP